MVGAENCQQDRECNCRKVDMPSWHKMAKKVTD